ncbi:MAG: phenylalanine--tRNA ligase subunit beta [Hydrogenophilaceae bacterium]|nr:phenylalanine--tRNA ligase subunit beta [Hydrogenophilaceae bacterium]
MQFPESWLRTLVNPQLTTAELAQRLTMAGLEVESVQPAAPPFTGVVVAEVLSVESHPDADRLRVCKVNVGESSPLQIVCGAPNVAAGQKVPCARVGAKLPALEIAEAKVRGVASFGMLCGASEIGLEDRVDGLLVLPADAPVGADIRSYLALDDSIITLKLTPNRADCLSLVGLAREVSAITGTRAYLPTQPPVMKEIYDTFNVEVQVPEACPRYVGRVIKGINPDARTPDWMVMRLQRSGIRPISAPVDITNYVLLELGQPMHAFDLDKLSGGIQVRWAEAGETLTLLNEQNAELSSDMLVIADSNGPLALAGIMGGAASAVGPETANIFLEAAFFAPEAISGRARRLGLATDSSHRFERGVDHANTPMAMERATKLILEICGGQPGPVVEETGKLPRAKSITLRPQRVTKVLGIELSQEVMRGYLQRLGLVVKENGDAWHVTPPAYRFDLEIEEDLIEEIARLHGYDQIEASPPRANTLMLPVEETIHDVSLFRNYLAGRDYQEVITYSFVDPAWESALLTGATPIALQNPISSQLSVMRSTLWGGLINALAYNLNRQQNRVRLFESGRVYLQEGHRLRQPHYLAGLCHGPAFAEQWGVAERNVDFFDVKGDLENLPGIALEFRSDKHPALHPGQCSRLYINGHPVGWLGTLHHKLVQFFDLQAAPVLFELELDALGSRLLPRHAGVSRFPSVRRDLAFLVDQQVTAEAILNTMNEVRESCVRELALFDLYQGQGVPVGLKSLAFRVVMQDTERTLTEPEVEAAVSQIAESVIARHGAKLRS